MDSFEKIVTFLLNILIFSVTLMFILIIVLFLGVIICPL